MLLRNKWVQAALTGVVLLLLTTFMYTAGSTGTGGMFNFVEKPMQDLIRKAKFGPERAPDDRIKIVKIDNKSLKEIGKFPWDRAIYGKLIEKLEGAGVAAIGLDVVLAEPSRDPADDKAFAEVLSKYNNVVLATQFNFPAKQKTSDVQIPDKIDYPSTTLTTNPNQMAHINVIPDKDGIIRKLTVGLKDGNKIVPAFSVALANFLLDDSEKIKWDAASNKWLRGNQTIKTDKRSQVATEFYSKPRQDIDVQSGYESFSASDILAGKEYPLEGAVVLIGPFETGMQDEYLTIENKSIKMFGIEIHANMIQSLTENKFFYDLNEPLGILLLIFIALISVLLFERFKGRAAIFIFLGLFLGYIVIWLLLVSAASLQIPIFYPLLLITLINVASYISHYLAERKERSRVTNIFGRFVAKSVVDELLQSGEDVKLGGSRKDISLIFVDIRGFTPMSERLEPEQVIQVLNEYLDVCTKAIFKFNGTLDKFMGDGVMAMFGAPIAFDNHPEMAIKSALEMKRQGDELEKKLIEKYGIGVRFGLGINSGPAVVGNIGSEGLRLDYTAIGDTVNLSARLESNAKPGQILISENTYERVKDLFLIEPVGEIKVKGKEHPVMVYEVMGNL
jgi:adenylate cyclase